ncbi:MAG: ATP-binding protein [Bacteroidales bacterium]|jgi:signal transduction histidine kinase
MQNIWNYISNLGINEKGSHPGNRTIVLCNQINFVMFITLSLLLIYTLVALLLRQESVGYGTLRVAIMLMVNLLNLVIARYGFTELSKLSLIYLPPVVFLLGPTLIGFVEEESYTYYPYVLISVSIIPQILLDPKKEKFHYWFSLAYYLILVIFIDRIMVLFSANDFIIVERIKTFYPFYKIAHIGLFIFINVCIFYLRRLNFTYEEALNTKNKELDQQNKELIKQKYEIEQQKFELVNKEISTWQKLVNIISHEIVNSAIPITNLAGISSQMLESDSGAVLKPELIGTDVTEDIHHSLKIIESRTKGLINFVKATKSITQIPRPSIRKISVNELFERITILFRARFKETGIQFKTEIVPVDLKIEADLEMIEQVIINLIQNSLDAMQGTPDPRLSIIAGINESGHAQILVSDNGTGINDEVLERIFLPYFSTKPNNSGIGLSLSQQIMMVHNGRLEVKAGLKQGAAFLMIF